MMQEYFKSKPLFDDYIVSQYRECNVLAWFRSCVKGKLINSQQDWAVLSLLIFLGSQVSLKATWLTHRSIRFHYFTGYLDAWIIHQLASFHFLVDSRWLHHIVSVGASINGRVFSEL